ncbi:MAG: GumC family protein [Phycisphaerae bacterium]
MNGQNHTSSEAAGPRARPPRPHSSDPRHTLSEIIRVISHRWLVFVVPFCLGTSAALLATHWIPRIYTATTIFERRDDVAIANLVRKNSPHSFDTIRRSLALDLKGPKALAEALRDLAASGSSPRWPQLARLANQADNQQALSELARNTELKLLEKSPHLDLIEVRCHGTDPLFVQNLANRLRDNYVRRTRQQISRILRDAEAFFQAQASRHRQRVEQLEAELISLETEYPGIDPTDPKSIYTQLESLRAKQQDLRRRRQELRAKIRARQAFLNRFDSAETSPGSASRARTVTSHQRLRLEAQIQQVRDQITDLKTIRAMTELHPEVLALRRKLARLQAALVNSTIGTDTDAATGQAGPDSKPLAYTSQEYLAWLAQRAPVQMELQALQEILAATEGYLQTNARELARVQALQDQLAEKRQAHRAKLAALERAKSDLAVWERNLEQVSRHLAAEQQDRGIQFRTIQEAQPVARPSSPRPLMIFVLSIGLGLAIAAACVVLAELLDRSFQSAGQVVRSLGIPVLEGIDEIVTPALRRRRLIRQMVLGPVLGVALVGSLGAAGMLTYLRLERPAIYDQLVSNPAALLRQVQDRGS